MKEFYLNNIDKAMLFFAFIFALCFLGFGSFPIPAIFEYFSNGIKFPFKEFLIVMLCYTYAVYLFVVIITTLLCKYKSICVDELAKKLIIKSKNQQLELFFDDISEIKVRTGSCIAGKTGDVRFGCVKIRDKNNNNYTCIISKYGYFYDALPEYINKSYDFQWFITTW